MTKHKQNLNYLLANHKSSAKPKQTNQPTKQTNKQEQDQDKQRNSTNDYSKDLLKPSIVNSIDAGASPGDYILSLF